MRRLGGPGGRRRRRRAGGSFERGCMGLSFGLVAAAMSGHVGEGWRVLGARAAACVSIVCRKARANALANGWLDGGLVVVIGVLKGAKPIQARARARGRFGAFLPPCLGCPENPYRFGLSRGRRPVITMPFHGRGPEDASRAARKIHHLPGTVPRGGGSSCRDRKIRACRTTAAA